MRADEPVLSAEDRRIWGQWERLCRAHARTGAYRRQVSAACGHIEAFMQRPARPYVAWSAGKDSTALAHLVRVGCGIDIPALSIKDDLDFPGEETYVRELAAAWGLRLDVEHPPFSLQAWLRAHAGICPGDDLHGRDTALSSEGFYAVIDAYRERTRADGVLLGLRKFESKARLRNRAFNGPVYQRQDGHHVAQPLCDWDGLTVFAYLFTHEIPVLPVYRCVRFAKRPDQVRKSWWMPGQSAQHGQTIWLRTYWPSLWERACELIPDMRSWA